MNKKVILSVLILSSTLNTMEPPDEKAKKRILVPRSQTAPLQFPSDDQDKELNEFFTVKDDMELIKKAILNNRIARKNTPEIRSLVSLDPAIARTHSKNIHQAYCQESILDGATRFDKAQARLTQLKEQKSHYLVSSSILSDHQSKEDLHAAYLAEQNQQIEALCTFVTAYEKECYEMFNYIIPVLDAILLLERERRELSNRDHIPYIMHPRLQEFKEKIRKIGLSEQVRKTNRRSLALPPEKKLVPDTNKANELCIRGRRALRTADGYYTKITQSPTLTISSVEYSDIENLFCDGLKKLIKGFHIEPSEDEKKKIFHDIQFYLAKIQTLQREALTKKLLLNISDDYTEICKFVTFNTKQYELALVSARDVVTWQEAIHETLTVPLPKAKWEKFLDILKKPFKK